MADRVLVSLDNICLNFGGKPLFEELGMHVLEGDKICFVGKNGAGKTSLMRLILGEIEPDGGTRFILPGITFGYLEQQVQSDAKQTAHAFVMSGLKLADQNEDQHHLADIIIGALDVPAQSLMGTLSGGQLRRAALARALIEAPDVLMLDEPTNHLDLAAIEWLEQYLASYRGALICVSHDRAFLANISRKVFWIDRGMIRVCPTGYKGFDDWAEQIIEQEARELQNMQKKLASEIDWTQGGVKGRRKRNQRRLAELYKLREKLKNEKAAQKSRSRTIEIDNLTPVQASKIIVEFKHVSKSFKNAERDIPILQDFNLRILRGDRIGIIGKNGSGKSTFVKLLVGELEPDAGRIFRGKTIDIAYFDQSRIELDPENTLWGTLCADGGDYVFLGPTRDKPRHVCGYLKDFLFDPKIARSRVSTLSGGQQNRLMLAKLLTNPGNVLILDEPTNDLDMETLDMLQELLADYQGTLIIVSHDRDFLDRTVTEVLAFEGEAHVESHIGGYTDYIAAKKKASAPAPKKQVANSNAHTTQASEATPLKQKMSGKERHELEKLPQKISALEKEIAELNTILLDVDLYTKNPELFDGTSKRFHQAQSDLENAETRWLELEEKKNSD